MIIEGKEDLIYADEWAIEGVRAARLPGEGRETLLAVEGVERSDGSGWVGGVHDEEFDDEDGEANHRCGFPYRAVEVVIGILLGIIIALVLE